MSNPSRNTEKKLYKIWQEQGFDKSLTTVSGDAISVLHSGEFDANISGPDFKNAKLKIGNFTLVGDVEIESSFENWKIHGHNIDRKYSKVILHVCLFNKKNLSYVYNKEGRKIPTLCLSDYLSPDLIEEINDPTVEIPETDHTFKCSGLQTLLYSVEKEEILKQLGVLRYKRKCTRFYDRLKELAYLKELNISEPKITYDLNEEFQTRDFTSEDFRDQEIWQQLFYEMLLEALGYSQNKNIMLKLAQSGSLDFLRKFSHEENLELIIESTLLNIAGLMPDSGQIKDNEILRYIESVNEYWSKIGRIYDGEIFDSTEWHFFKLRPQNFPTVRISGGARLVKSILDEQNLISVIIKKFTEIWNPKVLINNLRSMFVIKSEGFWQHHYVFDQPANGEINYFIGISRADEIVINVVFPFLSVYFDVFGKSDLSKKVINVYSHFEQKAENKIVREVAEALNITHLAKKTIFTQGMIELFRNYCSKGKCLECEIGKKVFE